MKMMIVILGLLGGVSCGHLGYRLSPAMAGTTLQLEGTILAVEADGDLLLETGGRLAFVDVGDLEHELEMGDQVTVTGVVEADTDEGEAAELDATAIFQRGQAVAE
jgi:hypothetical protein